MTDLGDAPTYTDTAGRPREAVAVFGALGVDFDPSDVLRVIVIDLDTAGNPVPTYLAHAFTYDGSGNLQTDTVVSGSDSWVRTYAWTNGAQTADSGWVKQ
jgi:hypothetical protein